MQCIIKCKQDTLKIFSQIGHTNTFLTYINLFDEMMKIKVNSNSSIDEYSYNEYLFYKKYNGFTIRNILDDL